MFSRRTTNLQLGTHEEIHTSQVPALRSQLLRNNPVPKGDKRRRHQSSSYQFLRWVIAASLDCIFYVSPRIALSPFFQNKATGLFVALAAYSTPVQPGMTPQRNSHPGVRRNVSIPLRFGGYITSCSAWCTCLPKPVADWKTPISSDRLHLVVCINMCLNLPKARVLCCVPGNGPALESVRHPAESRPTQPPWLPMAPHGSTTTTGFGSSPLGGGGNATKGSRPGLTQAVHLAQGRGSVQGARFYLCRAGRGQGETLPCLKGYGNSGGNFNKGKGTSSKVFNWTSLKATKKLLC